MTHGQTNGLKTILNPKLYHNVLSKTTLNISVNKANCAMRDGAPCLTEFTDLNINFKPLVSQKKICPHLNQ